MAYVLTTVTSEFAFEIFFNKTGCGDIDKFTHWFTSGPKPIEFTAAQKQRMRDNADFKAANLLLSMARDRRLKQLREFGLYENVEYMFSDAAVGQTLDLAERIQRILVKSRDFPLPEPLKIAGINMPKGEFLKLEK